MRRIVIDFYLTVLFPLIILSLFVLGNAIRTYIKARADCKATMARIKGTFSTKEEGEELLAWGKGRCKEQHDSKDVIVFSVITLGVLCAVMLLPDGWKLSIAYQLWLVLYVISAVSFIAAIPMTWHYIKKSEWVKVAVCFLGILMAAASTEHFLHQRINSGRIVCPDCDDNDRPDDN